MSWYGDPDELERLAARLGARADTVREEARDIRAGAGAARWHGEAASAFTAALERDLAGLEQAARRFEDAAAQLRQHAMDVRETLARIRAVEAAVTGWFTDQARMVERAADALVDAVRDPLSAVRDAVVEPPWSQWPWRPGRLPLPGSKEWLDVGDFLRRQGAPL